MIGAEVYDAPWSSNDVMMFDDITCSGTETSISDCTVTHSTEASLCGITNVAGIKCQSNKNNNNYYYYYYNYYNY